MSIAQPFSAAASHQAIVERDEAVAELERARRGVTVCITYHDEALDLLARALASAAAQTVAPHEIIIVDDGSEQPLATEQARHLLGRNTPRAAKETIRVVRVTNRGLPAARNTGIMLAQGIGFLPLDADDWLEPTYIEKTLELLLRGADVVLTGLQEHGPTRYGTYKPGFDRPWHLVTLADEIETNRFFYCSLMRLSLLREVGGYNPLMAGAWNQSGGYEDHDLWVDLMTRKARFAATDEILFNYTASPNGSMVHRAALNRAALVAEMRRHHRLDR